MYFQFFFKNKLASPSDLFTEFIDTIGSKVSLIGWTGFRGDYGKDAADDAYFTNWRGFESNKIEYFFYFIL